MKRIKRIFLSTVALFLFSFVVVKTFDVSASFNELLKGPIEEEIVDLYNDFESKYERYYIEEAYQYDGDGLALLENIFNDISSKFDGNILTKQDLIDANLLLDDVLVKASFSNVRPNVNDVDEEGPLGFFTSSSSFKKDTTLNVEELSLFNENKVLSFIEDESLVHKTGSKAANELKLLLENKELYGMLDIYLKDSDDVVVEPSAGVHEVSLLLPETLRNRTNISVLYLQDDLLEVYDVSVNGKWIVFETDHLSHFYLMADLVEVSFDICCSGGSGPDTQYLPSGSKAEEPVLQERVGYNFLGWYNGEELFDFNDEVYSNLTLVAKWEAIVYDIEYVLYEDNPNDPVLFEPVNLTYTIESDFLIEVPDDRDSSVFVGWYTNSSFTGDALTKLSGSLIGDVTLYAKWEKRVHTVTFILNDEVYHEVTVVHSELIENFPADPTKEGYDFIGWRDYTDTHINELTPINKSMELNAFFYFATKVVVTFVDELVGDFEIEVDVGEKLIKPADPEKEGYLFVGWYLDDVLFDFNTEINEPITLKAVWRDLVQEAKDELKDHLLDYILNVDEPKEHLLDLIDDLVDEVDLDNYEDLESLKTSGEALLLEEERDFVKGLMDDYLESVIDESTVRLDNILSSNKTSVDEELVIEDLKGIFDNYKDKIDEELVLMALREASKVALDEMVEDLELSPEVEQIISDNKALIDDADTLEDINQALSNAKKAVMDQLIIEAQVLLDEYLETLEGYSQAVEDIIDNGKDELLTIDNVEDLLNKVEEIKNDALIQHQLDLLNKAKSDAIDELETLAGDEYSDKVETLLTEAINSINDATTIAEVEDALIEYLDKIQAQLDLEAAQKDAIDELETLAGDEYSNKVETLLNEALNKIDKAETVSEVEDILTEYLEKIETQLKVEKAQKDFNDALNEYISEVKEPTTHLTNYIESLKDFINENNYLNVDSLIESHQQDLLGLEKDFVKGLLDELKEDDDSDKVLNIISDYHNLIDRARDIEKIKTILEQAILDVETQKEIDTLYNSLEEKHNEFITNDKHYYDEEGLEDIKNIYNDAKEKYLNDLITKEELENLLEDLDNVPVRYTNNKVRVDDSIKPDEGKAIGYASSKNGFVKGTELIVEVKELTDEDIKKILDLINNNKVVDKSGNLNVEELVEELLNLATYGKLDIYLVDSEGNRLTDLDVDEFEVSLLLPKELLDRETIKMLYVDDSLLEVFDIELEDEWLTFKTDHFSDFFLIGEEEQKIYLWWVIIVELVVIMIILALIIAKYKDNKKRKALQANALVLPLLAAIVPVGTQITIIVLLAIIALELVYLIYLFLTAPAVVKKEVVVEREIVVDNPEQEVKEIIKEVIVEKPVIKEVIKEVIVEKPVEVIKEVVVEKPVEVVKEVVVEKPVEEPKEEPEHEVRTIYNYSFKSRLHLADEETENRYNDLKNHLLSYDGVSSNMSWKQETFTVKGKMVVKLRLQGKTMRVFLGVDPKDYEGTKYNVQDMSNVKTHATTPSLLVVKGPGILNRAKELIDEYMKENEIAKIEDYKTKNYKERDLQRPRLIELGLIKCQEAKFIKK